MSIARRRWLCCTLLLASVQAAPAEEAAPPPSPPANRAGLVQTGHAAWLVQGGPLSPLEAEATRQGDAYLLTVRGMYPIMDMTGKIADPGTQISFWAQRGMGPQAKYLREYDQTVKSAWRPGDAFVATFKVGKSLIEGRDPAYLAICMGTAQSCWPSTNLSPP